MDIRSNSLSDEQLRALPLEIDDPYSQPNLLMQIPAGAELRDIINTYRFAKYPKEKCLCAKCRAHLHRDGFTARLVDGSLVLLGSKCGADLFETSWKEAETDCLRRIQRKRDLLRLDRDVPLAQDMLRALGAWGFEVDRFEVVRTAQLKRPAGEKLGFAANREDGLLMLRERFRNYAAEAERDRKRKGDTKDEDDAEAEPIWDERRRPVHRIAGASYFRRLDLRVLLAAARSELEKMLNTHKATDKFSDAELSTVSGGPARAYERLVQVWEVYAAAPQFFQPGNLEGIVHWLNNEPQKGDRVYRRKASTIVCATAGGETSMGLISNYRELDPAVLEVYRGRGDRESVLKAEN